MVDPIIRMGYGKDSNTGTIIRMGYATFLDLRTKTITADTLVGRVEVDGIEIDIIFTLADVATFTIDTLLLRNIGRSPQGQPRPRSRAPVVIPVFTAFNITADAWQPMVTPMIVEANTTQDIVEHVSIVATASTPVETSTEIMGTAFIDTDSMFETSANTYNVVDTTMQVEADNYSMIELSSHIFADAYVNVSESVAVTGIASQDLDTDITVTGTKNIDEILLLLDDDLWLLSQIENAPK